MTFFYINNLTEEYNLCLLKRAGQGDNYFIYVPSLCERKQHPPGTQMMMLQKKTILILFLMCGMEKTSKHSLKTTGKLKNLFLLLTAQ